MSKAKAVKESAEMHKLDQIVETASLVGNVGSSEYMLGLANGLILAQATLRGVEPEFLSLVATGEKSSIQAIFEAEACRVA